MVVGQIVRGVIKCTPQHGLILTMDPQSGKILAMGSTFKIITFTGNDSIIVGVTLHCYNTEGHGVQAYLEVAKNSCNQGFVSFGQKLGVQKLMRLFMNYSKKCGD